MEHVREPGVLVQYMFSNVYRGGLHLRVKCPSTRGPVEHHSFLVEAIIGLLTPLTIR